MKIQIILKEQGPFTGGDVVEGYVHVAADKEYSARSLKFSLAMKEKTKITRTRT